MKANEFVKKHGLRYTKSIILQFPNHTHVTDDGRMFINENTCLNHIKSQLNETVKIEDLKRLVESHELVESVGGWSNATALYDEHLDKDLGRSIADVESCQ